VLDEDQRERDFYKYNYMAKFHFKVFLGTDEYGVPYKYEFQGKIWYMKDKQKCLRCLKRSVDEVGEICEKCLGNVDLGLFEKYKDWLLLMR